MLAFSVSNREGDIVAALDGGANDYMTKPFSETELLSRLRVLRRCIPGELDEPALIEGDLRICLLYTSRPDLFLAMVHLSVCQLCRGDG